MISRLFSRRRHGAEESVRAYNRFLDDCLRSNRGNRDKAFAEAIGAQSLELFHQQGDGHVAVLRSNGLQDGMSIFDLGCGSGRTAQALQRADWSGRYSGSDIVQRFIDHLKEKCPGFEAYVNHRPTILAEAASVDIVFHWSVFTHVSPEECFLYMKDTYRALKPGGKLIFSFLELTKEEHHRVFFHRVDRYERGVKPMLPDTFLHRDWIAQFASQIGFTAPVFTDGDDASKHPPFWQTLVAMQKPDSSTHD